MTQFYATMSKAVKQGVFETAMNYIRSAAPGAQVQDEPHVVQLAPLIVGFREVEVDYSGTLKEGLAECKWILDNISEMGLLFEGVHDVGLDRALWVPWASVVGLRFLYRDEDFTEEALKAPAGPQEAPEAVVVESPRPQQTEAPAGKKGPARRKPGDYLDVMDGEGES